jgi:hypothetical protein
MRLSAELPATLPPTAEWIPWTSRAAVILKALRRLGHSAKSLGTRTTLVQDPFSAEQSRD